MSKDIFHVHTYRCGHAGEEKEIEYINRAVELGADSITFTDHAPFPNNPFGGRMKMAELDDYIYTLGNLRKKYADRIDIKIGLEVEFFPEYIDYYKELRNNKSIDILLLGQHMYSLGDGSYSFHMPKKGLDFHEARGLGMAIVLGTYMGFFDVIAHPDRVFRRKTIWTNDMDTISNAIIDAAVHMDIPLEINESSKHYDNYYWSEFWDIAREKKAKVINGLDAHSVAELKLLI